jgi:multiple sugar transport system ATP-binding protein
MATTITIKNLTKRFGTVVAVNNISLTIEPGSFLTLLGPSGCGKTTLLRCIAGLEDPDEGEIYVGERLVFSHRRGISIPSGQRELGMVFQNYALWPHMTVYKNIAFALEIQKMSRAQMDQRIKEALAEVQMDGYQDRYPREMSGGQQQRIALARMLAYRPKVFLMDEPLSNLDARLRMDMRSELKRLHHDAGATTLYVTHDQLEALTMSSCIAVIKQGVIQQLDTPDRIYHFPSIYSYDLLAIPR